MSLSEPAVGVVSCSKWRVSFNDITWYHFSSVCELRKAKKNVHSTRLEHSIELMLINSALKGHFTLNSKIHIIPFTSSHIYPSGLFWWEPLWENGCTDVWLLSKLLQLDYTQLELLKIRTEQIH